MENQDGSVIIKVDLDLDSFQKTGGEAKKLADNLTKDFKKAGESIANGIKKAFDVTLKAIAITSAGITAASALGINYNMQMEDYLADFTVMLGDAEAATQHVEKLKTMAAKTPFEMTDLAKADKVLLAFGSDAEEVQGQLQMLGDISLGNSDKLGTLATAFGRIQSNGRASMEEINMMIDSGFNPLNIIAQQTGETMEEVRDRVSKGAVSFEEISGAMKIATSAGGQFYQGMEVASKTASGQISTLKDNVNALLGDMTKGLFDGLKNELLPRVTQAVEDIHTAFNEGGMGAALETASNIITGFIGEIAGKAPGAIKTMLKTILPKIKQAGRTMILALVEAVLGEDIASKLEGVFDSVDDAFGRMALVIADNADKIGAMITDIIEIILDIAEVALPILIDGISWMIDNLDILIPIIGGVATAFVALKAISAVQGIITGISGAFSALSAVLMANPIVATIGLVAGALGLIVGSAATASDGVHQTAKEFAALTEEQQKAIDSTREYIDEWENVKTQASDRAEAVESEYGYYQQLSDELKTIVDENGKIKQGYEERAKTITTTLSDALGIEIEIVDDQIQNYQDLQGEIDKTIEKKMAEAQLDAYRSQYLTAMEKQNQLEKDYLSILDTIRKKEEERKKLIDAVTKARAMERDGLEGYTWLMEEYGLSAQEVDARVEALDETISECSAELDASGQALMENKATLQLYGEAQSALANGEMAEFNDAILKLSDSMLTAETATEESLKRQLENQTEILEQMEQAVRDGSTAITEADIAEQRRRVELAENEYNKSVNLASTKAMEAAKSYAAGIEDGKGPISEALGDSTNMVKRKMEIDLRSEGQKTINSFIGGLQSRASALASTLNQLVGSATKKKYTYYEPPAAGSGPGSDVYALRYTPIDIPQLAKGTVIPPNAPYLAIVGDQKSGTNVEAPLSTIKEAVAEALVENSGSGNRQIVIPVYISGRQVYEAVVEENDMNTIATGRNALA